MIKLISQHFKHKKSLFCNYIYNEIRFINISFIKIKQASILYIEESDAYFPPLNKQDLKRKG